MTHAAHLRPRDFLPDPRRPRLLDHLARNLYLKSAMTTTHSTLTVGNEQSTVANELQRIKAVTVDDVTGGTVTVQVYVDGVPLFEDAHRPVSGGGVGTPSGLFNFPRGAVVTTTIEADSGVPSGNANIVIDTEPFVLVPPTPEVELKGKDRLRPSRRRAVERFNEFGDNRIAAVLERAEGAIGTATRTATILVGETDVPGPASRIPPGTRPGDGDFDPGPIRILP